jgi:hypothetical protein
MLISELQHKVDQYERERGELEDKIRLELSAGIVAAPGPMSSRRNREGIPPHAPPRHFEPIPEEDGGGAKGGCDEACWCGARGDEGGDLAGDGGWTGFEGLDEEGPAELVHEEGCAQGASASQRAPRAAEREEGEEGEEEGLTPLELLEKVRKDPRFRPQPLPRPRTTTHL